LAARREDKMKVILLKDVKKVGKKDEIVDVSDGYATNFLIPRKLAVPYNERTISQLKANQARALAEEKAHKEEALVNKKKLEEKEISFILAIGEKGKAFGAITAKKVEEKIKEEFKINVDRRKFVNFQPLNQLGPTIVEIELFKDVIAKVKVLVKDKE
jgi:large subunit ribosomal protein L9